MIKNSSDILDYIKKHPLSSSKAIHDGINIKIGYATTKRILKKLQDGGFVTTEGKGRATVYSISQTYKLTIPISIDEYFEQEIDERIITEKFNLTLIPELLPKIKIFTDDENKNLSQLQKAYESNVSNLSPSQFSNELERLAIDLSWKSSQIEGNTYSLLETERLLKEKEEAEGKKKDEATMLLNHKDAIDFIIQDPSYLDPISISRIEDIHSILIKDLGVDRNVRNRRVGISGTNYKPLENEFQIREALQHMCILVNNKESVFEKAFLTLIILSYIQAFDDGNKRTARIVSNALLINNKYCPLSFRTISSIEYKKAMLIFYEQNNITVLKDIFMQQFEFAVKTYF